MVIQMFSKEKKRKEKKKKREKKKKEEDKSQKIYQDTYNERNESNPEIRMPTWKILIVRFKVRL